MQPNAGATIIALSRTQSDLDKFNQSFEFVETPDQLTAILNLYSVT